MHIVLCRKGEKSKVIDVSEVKVFVLDEADNMLDQDGLGDQTLRVKK
jgi:ATP-dependent RNA helicase DDX19/DBP5